MEISTISPGPTGVSHGGDPSQEIGADIVQSSDVGSHSEERNEEEESEGHLEGCAFTGA